MEQSLRQKRKTSRGGGLSRPNRRAADRHASALTGYEGACKSNGKAGASAYTKPGAHKAW